MTTPVTIHPTVSTGAGAFTPGPWECRRALQPDNTGGFDYAIAAGGKIIAEAFEHVDYAEGRDGYDYRPVAANARLIAAAPDLYEALELCLIRDPSLQHNAMVIAALAKARGESA